MKHVCCECNKEISEADYDRRLLWKYDPAKLYHGHCYIKHREKVKRIIEKKQRELEIKNNI